MNKNIIKQQDLFEKQIDKNHNELNKTILQFKQLIKTIKQESKNNK